MPTYRLRITGRVQGVGFRDTLRCKAEQLGITGWVRNRTDGSVEAMIQGTEASLQSLISWARQGPPAARVAALQTTAEDAPRYAQFALLTTA